MSKDEAKRRLADELAACFRGGAKSDEAQTIANSLFKTIIEPLLSDQIKECNGAKE